MLEHQMSRMSQPPYSPALAPSDFCLFHTVKNRLESIHTVDGADLFEQLLEILQAIPVDEFERVLTSWIDRARDVSHGNGDYIAQ
jgi:hypothetical protein